VKAWSYYNDIDKKVCSWVKGLIKRGLLPDGYVDERPIQEIKPEELKEFTQVHMFCGIGGWSEALRQAGWPPNEPVWTGSCPCQSFSSAGQQKGFDDPRHLWPVWYELIKECRPPVLFGEQVAAAIRHGWLDLVQNDLEAEGYSTGAVVLPACGVGAPHKRDRLWFMAYCDSTGLEGWKTMRCANQRPTGKNSVASIMANGEGGKCIRQSTASGEQQREDRGSGFFSCMAHTQYDGCNEPQRGNATQQDSIGSQDGLPLHSRPELWATDGYWGDADWIYCQDQKFRAIEPGTLPLADGVQERLVQVRGYGNAIVPQVAAEVIKAGMAYLEERA